MMKKGMIKCDCGNEFYFQSIREVVPCMACGKMHSNEGEPISETQEELVNNPVIKTHNTVSFEDSLCEGCIHHSHYWDEVDGELYDDGCYCKNLEAQSPIDYHLRNCYSGIKGCPYFESTEEELTEEENE